MPECKQFEMGISTKRYLPAIGTAGFDRVAVSGDKRLPWPPPSTMEITLDVIKLVLSFRIVQCIVVLSEPMKNQVLSFACGAAAFLRYPDKVVLP